MRFLEADSMLAMIPADGRVTDQALARLFPLLSRYHSNTKRLPALVEKGELKTAQLNSEGQPAYVVWYRVEFGRLVIDTLTGIGHHTLEQFRQVFAPGVEMIARLENCTAVEGVTPLSGLARLYLENGYEAKGVLVRKELSNV